MISAPMEFQDAWWSNEENPSAYWGATLSYPFTGSNYASSESRSDLVLDADLSLDFWS